MAESTCTATCWTMDNACNVNGAKKLHQSRRRFMPIEFGQDGIPHNKKSPTSADAQDFYKLRAHCVLSKTLFEDPEFPANAASLAFSGESETNLEWLRPHEIAQNPVFFENSYSRFDINQGKLGDCWLLAAAASLTENHDLFSRVVPEDNSFTQDYAGIFHFRFWRFGQWYDVVIDDRLPTHRGQLIYMRSTETNEFWSALLEKAYAKLFGSYEALTSGSASEAMVDFTGGIAEIYELKDAPKDLFQIIEKGFWSHAMFACLMTADPHKPEAETPEGLIRGHAYSLTMAKSVDIQLPHVKGKVQLVRLRNPWGNANEWNGAWSDESPEWKFIPEHMKREMGLTFEVDGEFWMSFDDFQKYFDRIEICNMSPDCPITQRRSNLLWKQSAFEGEWVVGNTAGGSRKYPDTFWYNPQYVITLEDPDKDDAEAKATVIIALMQKHRRSKRNKGIDCLSIGFILYRVTEQDLEKKPLSKEFFLRTASVAKSAFLNLREVTCRFRLDPGTYVVIPSTFDPNIEGEFMIRTFSECSNCMSENEQSVGVRDLDPRIAQDISDPTKPSRQQEAMERLFHDVAGDDDEVDWMELKMVLDHCFRDDIAIATRRIPMPTKQSKTKEGTIAEVEPECCGLLAILAGRDNTAAQNTTGNSTISKERVPLLSGESNSNGSEIGFSKDVCRSMVAMLDEDHSGKLGFLEFQKLLTEITRWKAVFKLYDQDRSGHLNPFELRAAMLSAGYSLNNKILNSLIHRYGSKEGEIWFDDFITCAVKIKTMIDIFKAKDTAGTDTAIFNMDEWIQKTIYT